MRKKVFGKNFSRARKSRLALARSLMRALVLEGKITTTKAKAIYLSSYISKEIAKAKKATVPARRSVLADLGNSRKITDLIFQIAKNYKGSGTITKIIPLSRRQGDQAEMARVELMSKPDIKETPKEKETKEVKPLDFSSQKGLKSKTVKEKKVKKS